jgi:hypothetical protein
MAFSTTNVAKLYAIFQLPKDTEAALILTTLAHAPITQISQYFPTYTLQDITTARTRITDILATCSAEDQVLVEAQITNYDTIATSPMTISRSDNGATGTIIDHAQERELIRQYIGNLLGISIPEGGWLGELKRMGFGGGGGGGYPYMGGGDR